MDQPQNTKTDNTVDQEQHLLKLYGKLPSKRDLLQSRIKERKYFDSGDFALSAAHKATTDASCPLKTGHQHPLLQNLPHLSSPVPSSSNVNEDADRPMLQASTSMSPVHENSEHSHLNRTTTADEEDMVVGKEGGGDLNAAKGEMEGVSRA